MWRATTAAFFLFLGLISRPVHAWHAGMIYDTTWGADVPLLDPLSNGTQIFVGFVHLPISGGYLFVTLQSISDSPYVVVTRFHEDGTLNTDWLDPSTDPYAAQGSAVLDTLVPDVDDNQRAKARLAADTDGTNERIYLAALTGSGSSLVVSRFDPNLDDVDIGVETPLALHYGFGDIEADVAGVPIGTSDTGLVVAVAGNAAEASTSILYGAAGTSFAVKLLAEHTGTGLRINDMNARSDGDIDVVGTQDGSALYMLARTRTGASISNLNVFSLSCPNGTLAPTSVFDAIAPASGSSSDSLVVGRVDCGSDGLWSVVERIGDIGSGSSARVQSMSTLGTDTNCADGFPTAPCFSYLATTAAAPDGALAFTPDGFLAHIDAGPAQSDFAGDEANAHAAGYPFVAPTLAFGATLNYPYLVGISSDSGKPGIRRIAVDRIFADGAGDFGM